MTADRLHLLAGSRAARTGGVHPGVVAGVDESDQRARLADLQRRLYRPDATAADLERYVGLRDELAAAAPAPEDPRPPTGPSRRRPLLVVGALLGAAAILGAVAVLRAAPADFPQVAAASASGTPRPGPSASASASTGGSSSTARFTDDAVTDPAGTTVEVAVDGARVLAQRFSGSGEAAVPLVTGGAPLDGGLLTVTLRSLVRESVSWQAVPGSAPSSPITGAPAVPRVGLSAPDSVTVRYRGAPPPRVLVQAPAGAGWTLTVAFSR